MKTIVTHFSPDTDAVTSVWLIKRFLPGWSKADVKFVPAGKTLDEEIVDADPDVLHVDTGLGCLDHHQTDEDTCAARRTLEYISKSQNIKNKNRQFPNEALERMLDVVNDIDHFREVYFPKPEADFYDLGLVSIIDGMKLLYPDDGGKIVDFCLLALDGIYKSFQNKVWAQKEIALSGVVFTTKMGKGVGLQTVNDEVVRLSQKLGYIIAIRKDPKKGYIRIKAQPESKIDLTMCYNRFREIDKQATWYLHPSKKMILNGSTKNPECRPTKMSLEEIIEIIKNVPM